MSIRGLQLGFDRLSLPLLLDCLVSLREEEKKSFEKFSKSDFVSQLVDDVILLGIRSILDRLSHELLLKMVTILSSSDEDGTAGDSQEKKIMTNENGKKEEKRNDAGEKKKKEGERGERETAEEEIEEVMGKNPTKISHVISLLPPPFLHDLCLAIHLTAPKVQDQREQLAEEIIISGTEGFFESLSLSTFQEFGRALDVDDSSELEKVILIDKCMSALFFCEDVVFANDEGEERENGPEEERQEEENKEENQEENHNGREEGRKRKAEGEIVIESKHQNKRSRRD